MLSKITLKGVFISCVKSLMKEFNIVILLSSGLSAIFTKKRDTNAMSAKLASALKSTCRRIKSKSWLTFSPSIKVYK